MLQCAYCKKDVDGDSFFCDQCGKEILVCELCGSPGDGDWCVNDGGQLIPAKSSRTPETPSRAQEIVKPQPPAQKAEVAPSPGLSTIPGLSLINRNLNLSVQIVAGDVFGRTEGAHAGVLGTYPSISGKHLRFEFDHLGWAFKDLGSSNGTKYNCVNTNWSNTQKVAVGTPVRIQDKCYILVANVEFVIEIENNKTTQRI